MKRRNNPFAKGVKGANPEAQELPQGKFYNAVTFDCILQLIILFSSFTDVSTSYNPFYN